jgi:toxin CcdB
LIQGVVQQFDVVENLSPLTRVRYPFAVVLQHDRISTFTLLVVAPLTAASPSLARTRLDPSVNIGGREYVVIIEELAGVQRKTLGRVVGSVEADRYAIVAALDMLFTGI